MNRSNIAAIALFAGAIFVLLNISPRVTRQIQLSLLQAVTPLLKTGSLLQTRVQQFSGGIETLEKLERENLELQRQNEHLLIENQTLRDLKGENDSLREQLGYVQRSIYELLPAEVIARDPKAWWSMLLVSRGSTEGLKEHLPVLTDDGVVGKTISVADASSRVLLLTDENCKIAARIENTQEQGIVSGQRVVDETAPVLLLDFLSRDAEIIPGQKVLTSDLGGIYPSGLLVGEVIEFEAGPMYGRALVRPAVNLAKMKSVFIVKGAKDAK